MSKLKRFIYRITKSKIIPSILYVPIQKNKSFKIEVNKNEIWKNGQFFQNDSISFQKKLDNYVVLEFKPGSYIERKNKLKCKSQSGNF